MKTSKSATRMKDSESTKSANHGNNNEQLKHCTKISRQRQHRKKKQTKPTPRKVPKTRTKNANAATNTTRKTRSTDQSEKGGLGGGRLWASPDRRCLRTAKCLRDIASSPVLSLEGVFASPRVIATRRVLAVLARPVFGKCLGMPTCLRMTCAFAQHVFRQCLPTPTWLHSGKCIARASYSGSVFGLPRVLAPRSVSARNVSSDAHMSSLSSPSVQNTQRGSLLCNVLVALGFPACYDLLALHVASVLRCVSHLLVVLSQFSCCVFSLEALADHGARNVAVAKGSNATALVR